MKTFCMKLFLRFSAFVCCAEKWLALVSDVVCFSSSACDGPVHIGGLETCLLQCADLEGSRGSTVSSAALLPGESASACSAVTRDVTNMAARGCVISEEWEQYRTVCVSPC